MTTAEEKQKVFAAYQQRSQDNPLVFIQGLIIPSATGPQPFYSCMAPYQKKCFKQLAPSLMAVRDKRKPRKRRFWWERTKKGSKDADIGCSLLWLAAFAKEPIYIQIGAADKGQAAIIKMRIKDIIHYNPWIQDFIAIHNWKIESEKALIEIMAADISGAHGGTPDVLVVNELSHVTKWEFIENLLDNARGVPHGVIIVATNAGEQGSKAHVLRKEAEKSSHWMFHVLDRPAPWITKEDLEEAKRTDSRSRYQRLWWGKWSSGKGDALDEDDVDQVFRSSLQEHSSPKEGFQYVMGIDLGVKHDHSAVVCLGVNSNLRKIQVAAIRSFKPSKRTGEVDLNEVEKVIHSLGKSFNAHWIGYDPTEATLMAQRLRKVGLPMIEVSFGKPANLTSMAESLIQVTESGILESFESEELRRDFGKFNIQEKKPNGYKLTAVSDEYGHADVGTALVICLPKAIEMLNGSIFSADDSVAFGLEDEKLLDEDIEEMPEEFREFFEMEEERSFDDNF